MKFAKLFLFVSILVLTGCDTIFDAVEKPEAIERETNFKIYLKDETGSMEKLYGKPGVPNVSVLIKSNSTGAEYQVISDEDGMIYLSNVLSDKYIISAVRLMSGEEMEIISGDKLDFYKLVNSKVGIVDLRADNDEIYTIPMDRLMLESPLLISEIYYNGPPGSGLYFHDKYIEIYNQSDSIAYLDGLVIGVVMYSGYLGLNYVDDPEYVHSKSIWIFPGNGEDYPILPGQYIVCAEDAIDHRINAPLSIDLTGASFEFYKDDAPDIDNPDVTNMIKIYQSSGNDWLIGGEKGALFLAQCRTDSLPWYDDQILISHKYILDGVEYMEDPTRLEEKVLSPLHDKGATGGASFYSGKSAERFLIERNGKMILKDENNSSLDFKLLNGPSIGCHHQQ